VFFEKVFEDLEDFLGEVLRDFEEARDLVDLESQLENNSGTKFFNLFFQWRLSFVRAEKALDLSDQFVFEPDFFSN
jgi:hypothetical protein